MNLTVVLRLFPFGGFSGLLWAFLTFFVVFLGRPLPAHMEMICCTVAVVSTKRATYYA